MDILGFNVIVDDKITDNSVKFGYLYQSVRSVGWNTIRREIIRAIDTTYPPSIITDVNGDFIGIQNGEIISSEDIILMD